MLCHSLSNQWTIKLHVIFPNHFALCLSFMYIVQVTGVLNFTADESFSLLPF